MSGRFLPLLFSGVILLASLSASVAAEPEPIGAVPATEAQSSIGLRRAQALLSALDEEEYAKLVKKRPLVAVRTLNATEEQLKTIKEQAAATGRKLPDSPLILVMLCNMKTQKIETTTCYAFTSSPRGNSLVTLGGATARFLEGY